MTDDLIFEDLPTPIVGRGSAVWARRLVSLRARPGEWARIPAHGNSMHRNNVRFGPEYEFTSRTVDGQRVLYGRYVGEVAK